MKKKNQLPHPGSKVGYVTAGCASPWPLGKQRDAARQARLPMPPPLPAYQPQDAPLPGSWPPHVGAATTISCWTRAARGGDGARVRTLAKGRKTWRARRWEDPVWAPARKVRWLGSSGGRGRKRHYSGGKGVTAAMLKFSRPEEPVRGEGSEGCFFYRWSLRQSRELLIWHRTVNLF